MNKESRLFSDAICNGLLAKAKDLYATGRVDLEVREDLEKAVLHVAARNGKLVVCQWLCEVGADVNARVHDIYEDDYEDDEFGREHDATLKFGIKSGVRSLVYSERV